MRRLLTSALALGLAVLPLGALASPASASDGATVTSIVDSLDLPLTNGGPNDGTNFTYLVFTATADGFLSSLRATGSSDTPMTAFVTSGEKLETGGGVGDTLLGQSAETTTTEGGLTFDWLEPIEVDSGSSYVMYFTGSGYFAVSAEGGTTNAYSANSGESYGAWQGWGGYYSPLAKLSVTDGLDAPTYEVAVDPAEPDGANGWYRTAPTVTITCADDVQVVACPDVPALVEGNNAGLSIGTVEDNTLLTTDAVFPELMLDTQNPLAAVKGVTDGKKYAHKPTARSSCSDLTSGIESCTLKTTKVRPGKFRVVTKATDKAGHVTRASKTYRVS